MFLLYLLGGGGFMKTREIAPESPQVQRAREKLVARWEEEQKMLTPEALHRVKETVRAQYARIQSDRVAVPGKFGKHYEVQGMSGKVGAVLNRVKADIIQQKQLLELPRIIRPVVESA